MDRNENEIDYVVKQAEAGFQFLQKTDVIERAELMYAIAAEIEALGDVLIETAHLETALPLGRLQGEKARTVNQWRRYADAVRTGLYSEVRIDRDPNGQFDLRKYNKGLGPVVVFGASNFPFAFSTAGGDTASAIGAGCSVIVKAHPAHLKTSQLMADAIDRAISKQGAPTGVFNHVLSDSFATGQQLVRHRFVKAVAFTGSFRGGKALFDLGQSRPDPIPVFAEMGSVNPVFLLPDYLASNLEPFAKQYIASLLLGVGQFCTNPGVLVSIGGEQLDLLKAALKKELQAAATGKMLHAGILDSYNRLKGEMVQYDGVSILEEGQDNTGQDFAQALLAEAEASQVLANPKLLEEVFGPFGLIISCADLNEMKNVMEQLEGQITITFAASAQDIRECQALFSIAQDKCGRLLFQGMPTGVEVQYAMHHGGPYPATTDARFTSVGPDAVKRFIRPISFQNWPNEFLPKELQDGNPLQIDRLVNQQWTKA
ncbi:MULTISPECIES: aldehyde dehydrogenase (NADP(+)) [Sphingobacterium]|uniref:NADP-dependent aldehyde dehydrogenase n=1 Tax=Sphingobacterium siyangense TaxID=459529 RepID=A0A562MAD2_9SPHI|nr:MULTISPECIES: aldehyde dehydrogenase (NADP(+)) [Sphingobacterium]TWI16897.1 NADP-dependent aldehyde dehydrogenase [Sphingobacterium siyangense]